MAAIHPYVEVLKCRTLLRIYEAVILSQGIDPSKLGFGCVLLL